MKRCLSLLLGFIFALGLIALAGDDKTSYVGGSEKQIPEGVDGSCSTGNEKEFVFEYQDGQLIIPYDQITDLEYGQQVGRRIRFAAAANPLLLLSKKRKHFLTISWKDESKAEHAAVFELGKSAIRSTIVTLETRTGKKVDYQDEEARKTGVGG